MIPAIFGAILMHNNKKNVKYQVKNSEKYSLTKKYA